MRVTNTTSTVRDICTFAVLCSVNRHSTFFVASLVSMKGTSTYSFLEVKLRGLPRKTYEDKYVTVLTVLITAGTGVTI